MSDVQQPPAQPEAARKIGIPLGLGIFFVPHFFAWLTLRKGHTKTQRQVAFGWLGFALLCGLMGNLTKSDRPSAVTGSLAAQAPPSMPASAPRLTEADIPLRVYKNEDHRSGIKDQKARHLIIQGDLDEAALRKALTDYYLLMRADLAGSRNPTRHVWLYAYPTEARAEAGIGEWNGMASARAFNGDPLPDAPELTIKMPAPDADAPTAKENQIYDELMEALHAVDSSGDYQKQIMATNGTLTGADIAKMSALQEQDEKNVNRSIAKKYKMTVKQLNDLFLKVAVSRQGK